MQCLLEVKEPISYTITIMTNSTNKDNFITKTMLSGTANIFADRVECRYGNKGGRELVASKPINLSYFTKLRMYGKFVYEDPNIVGEAFCGYFGVFKSDTIEKFDSVLINHAFLATKRINTLKADSYIEVDISKIKGVHSIGVLGYSQWDNYKFEVL